MHPVLDARPSRPERQRPAACPGYELRVGSRGGRLSSAGPLSPDAAKPAGSRAEPALGAVIGTDGLFDSPCWPGPISTSRMVRTFSRSQP